MQSVPIALWFSLKQVEHKNHIIYLFLLQTDMDMVGNTSAVTFHPAAENVVTTNAFTDKVHSFTLSIQLHNSIILNT